jgi:hypothetical protein
MNGGCGIGGEASLTAKEPQRKIHDGSEEKA